MENLTKSLFSLLFALCTTVAFAQDEVKVELTKLTDNIYKLELIANLSVNTVAMIGEDGILLVDDGLPNTSEKLREALKGLSDSDVKYVINTHVHGDHVGGNALFAEKAIIIAHKNTRKRMTTGLGVFNEQPEGSLPVININDEMTLYFNGEEIKLIHLAGGHTDTDVLVWFTKSGIVCMGDLLFADRFPFVDYNRGGDFYKYAEYMKKVYEMFPSETKFIAGHGRDYSSDDMKKYHEMMKQTGDIIQKALDEDKSVEEMKEAQILKGWESWGEGFIKVNGWIDAVVFGLTKTDEAQKEIIAIPLYSIYKESNIDDAIKQYYVLKKTHADKYDFGENSLNMLGYFLLGKEKIDDAIKIFQLNVEQFPESFNVYDSLGEAYMNNDDKKLAIKNYKKSLKLNPDNSNATEMLKKIEK